ncbi:MAG: UTP--glucose-1-phosphate uridylyltransferase, partial [Myxococcota bacterium]
LFIGDDGRPSYHAPGHGDFFRAIRVCGVLEKLQNRGIKYLLFSNVDNLGATVEPLVIGLHIRSGRAMTAEVTQKQRTASGAWDKGGAPALVDGELQIVEGFRFPADFAQETLPDFSTNNMLFNTDALNGDIPLVRHVVTKKVDGRPALQLESIACEASGVYIDGQPRLPLHLLRVPRDGPRGRFFPVKEPVDLDALRPILKNRLG